jgi:hypothetical protein
MEMGRPLALNFSQVSCTLPDDNPDFLEPGEKNVHMKAFNSQYIKLLMTTRAIYFTYYRKCAEVIGGKGPRRSLYQDPRDLEICAEYLNSKTGYLKTWLQQVPDSLKTPRKQPGQPFSTDQFALDFPPYPSDHPWLPLQRIVLELFYHNQCMNLYRPFISFTRVPDVSTPYTAAHATSCANHAIAMTRIIHQSLGDMNLLSGWYEIFQWQWNATLSLISSILANPGASTTTDARNALNVAMSVFEHLSTACASAVSAANVTGELARIVDMLVARVGLLESNQSVAQEQQASASSSNQAATSLAPDFALTSFDFTPEQFDAAFQNTLDSSTGFAFSLDEFGALGDERGGWIELLGLFGFWEFGRR